MSKISVGRNVKKVLFEKMVKIYCHGNHHEKVLCERCDKIIKYAQQRIDLCESKSSFCAKCETNCFKSDIREDIRKMMRYSGPRIIILNPILVLKYLLVK